MRRRRCSECTRRRTRPTLGDGVDREAARHYLDKVVRGDLRWGEAKKDGTYALAGADVLVGIAVVHAMMDLTDAVREQTEAMLNSDVLDGGLPQ